MTDPVQQALDAIKAGQSLSTTNQTPTYLGIPAAAEKTYQTPTQMQHQQVRRDNFVFDVGVPVQGQIQYTAADVLKPLQTPEIVLQLQSQLVQAGLLDVKSVRPGVWDSTSMAAYKTVLAMANQNGLDAQDMLAQLAANPKIGSQAPKSVNITAVTNPLDIAATAQKSAQALLGRSLSDEELKPFIANVQGLQTASDKKKYTMGATAGGKGGTVVDAPTQESSYGAEDYFKKHNPDEVAGYAAVEAMNNFYSLLHTPSGNVTTGQ